MRSRLFCRLIVVAVAPVLGALVYGDVSSAQSSTIVAPPPVSSYTVGYDGPEQMPVIYVHGWNDDGTSWWRGFGEDFGASFADKLTRCLQENPKSPSAFFTAVGLENWAVQWWADPNGQPTATAQEGYAFLSTFDNPPLGGLGQPWNRPCPSALDIKAHDPFADDTALFIENDYNAGGRAIDQAQDFLDLLRQERQGGGLLSRYRQVNVITHSKGGSTTRAMLHFANQGSRRDREYVSNVIYTAPPFAGSTIAYLVAKYFEPADLTEGGGFPLLRDPVFLQIYGEAVDKPMDQVIGQLLDDMLAFAGVRLDRLPVVFVLPPALPHITADFDWVEFSYSPAAYLLALALQELRPHIKHYIGMPGFPTLRDDLLPAGAAEKLSLFQNSPHSKQFVTYGGSGPGVSLFPCNFHELQDGAPCADAIAANPSSLLDFDRLVRNRDDRAVAEGSARLLTQTDGFGPRMTMLRVHDSLFHAELIQKPELTGKYWLEAYLASPTNLHLNGSIGLPIRSLVRNYGVTSDTTFSFDSQTFIKSFAFPDTSSSLTEVTVSAAKHEYRVVLDDGSDTVHDWVSVNLGESVPFSRLNDDYNLAGRPFYLEWRSINPRGGREMIRRARFVVASDPTATVFTWTGALSADWFNPKNWSPARVPGDGDIATINSGVVDLSGDRTVAELNFGGGTLTGGGALTVSETLNWTGGGMAGSGITFIPKGATMNISGSGFKPLNESRTINNDGTIVYNTTHPNGRVAWDSASAVINNRGLFDFQVDLDGIESFGTNSAANFNNAGTVRKSAGAGATVFVSRLHNDATVEVLSGTLRLASFNASTSSGAFKVAAGATLNFQQGTHNLTAASSIAGAGDFHVGSNLGLGPTVNVSGAYNVTGDTNIISGAVNFNRDVSIPTLNLGVTRGYSAGLGGSGTMTITRALQWVTGNMGASGGSGTTVIAAGATATISGADGKVIQSDRTLSNAGTITLTATGGGFSFCGGSFTLNNSGTIDLPSDAGFSNCNGPAGTINNTGTIKKSGGTGVSALDQTLNNNGIVEVLSGTLRLANASTSMSGGAFKIAAEATLNFQQGTHNLTAASSVVGAGAFNVGSDLGLGPTVNISGTYQVTGATNIISGTVHVNSDVSIPALNLGINRGYDAALGGRGTLTVTGTMNWIRGQMGQSDGSVGTTVIPMGAVLNISGPDNKVLHGRTLNNAGTINHTATGSAFGPCFSFSGNGFTLNNSGTFDIQNDASVCNGPGTINNTGTLKKSGGSGTSSLQMGLNNSGRVEILSGTLLLSNAAFVQTAGMTLLNGGTLVTNSNALPIRINGGMLAGSGIVEGALVNSGTVSPGLARNTAGSLQVTGDYTQTATGIVDIEIGGTTPGSQFDQLILGTDALNKRATFGGTINVGLMYDFRPVADDVFEIIRYSSRDGEFSAANGLDIGNGQTLTPEYRSNNLVLISSGANGGPPTGCGGPARIWSQIIAPRTARLHNFAGGTLYKGQVLYGNSGGTGALSLIIARFKDLRPEHVVTTEGINTETSESLPTVLTDPETGERSIPVVVFIPPDNPACGSAGGSGGDSGSNGTGGRSGGSFNFAVSIVAADGGGDGGAGGGGTGGGGTGGGGTGGGAETGGGANTCDPEFISENDVRATQVNTGQVGSCMTSLPGAFSDALLNVMVEKLISKIPGMAALERVQACYAAFAAAHESARTNSATAVADAAQQVLGCAGVEVPFGLVLDIAKEFVKQLKDGPCGGGNKTKFVFSCDPNDKVGASGAGEDGFITGEAPIPYAVFFENKPEASAAAQVVTITDQLDTSKFDLATFNLGAINFGEKTVIPPSGASEFNTEVDLRPDQDLLVRINAKLNKPTGLVTWRFASIDPQTLQPTLDPLAGFLPPNRMPSEGAGSVLFTVRARSDLASGTRIDNGARIIFDTNAPIDTPVWSNAIDNQKPSSHVQPLAAGQSSERFTVQWSGADADSGVANFTVFVSEDGSPFEEWVRNTRETSGIFQGQQGKSYGFFSVARDNTGNVEEMKTTAEATTSINTDQSSPVTTATLSPSPNAAGWHRADVTLTLDAIDEGSGVKEIGYTLSGAQTTAGESASGSQVSIPITAEGITQVTFFARDNAGNVETAHIVTVRIDKTAPTITCSVTPAMIWPPNHKLVPVSVAVAASDSLSGAAEWSLLSVLSNEGDVAADARDFVIGSADASGLLRATKAKDSHARIYTLTYRATDRAGNQATCAAKATVPHDQGKK